MKLEELKEGQLVRFIGKDPMGIFNCANIWKITDIDGQRIAMTDMKGVFIKTHSLNILRDFESFIPSDTPVIDWKTKYLGVVK